MLFFCFSYVAVHTQASHEAFPSGQSSTYERNVLDGLLHVNITVKDSNIYHEVKCDNLVNL